MSGQRSVAQYGHHSAPTNKTVGLPLASATGCPETGCGTAVEVPAPTDDSALAGTWVTASTAAFGAVAVSLPLFAWGPEATFAMTRAAITAATMPTLVMASRRRRLASAAASCSARTCAARARARFLLWLDIRLLGAPAFPN